MSEFIYGFGTNSKTCIKRFLKKRPKMVFKTDYRLMQEHSAILSTFIKLPCVFQIFVLSILSDRIIRQVLL